MRSKFEIMRSSDGRFYFVLKAGNYEVTATSETYTTKQSAKDDIQSLRSNAPIAEILDLT
jgi:uncharacterized protein YegP (UPF0339 family)